MLFDPARHETLSATAWDTGAADAAIERIVASTIAHYSPTALWSSHPLDHDGPPTTFYNLYFGAAGVMWALDSLAKVGRCPPTPDFSVVFDALYEANHEEAKDAESGHHGLLIADSGVLLLGARVLGTAYVAERLAQSVDANQSNPVLEIMWGSPGTMLAALFMHGSTGNDAWAEKFRRNAQWLWSHMEHHDALHCYLWRQELYGSSVLLLGGVHGFAGNAFPIIHGWHLLGDTEQAQWGARIAETLHATAISENGLVNWPQSVGIPRPGRTDMLMHHCHGAPGIINCLARLPNAQIDKILTMAGDSVWAAGPLKKGSNLCHGTAGNGYAFLKLFQRTKDEKWLYRARRFAMHAIEQCDRAHAHYGRHRYSLWTGDLGLAIYLLHCIAASAEFPTLDYF